jgi:hypothetical protein
MKAKYAIAEPLSFLEFPTNVNYTIGDPDQNLFVRAMPYSPCGIKSLDVNLY